MISYRQAPCRSAGQITAAHCTGALSGIMQRKRPRGDEDMQIRVAAGQPLSIKSFIARSCSSCAEQLPVSASVWDVSGLLTGGEPFSRGVVKTWVDLAYCALYGQSELDAEDMQQLSTATSLQQVLAFAQAVGSAEGLAMAACTQISALKFVIQLPDQTMELPVGTQSLMYFSVPSLHGGGGGRCLFSHSLQGQEKYGQGFNREQLVMLKQQLAGQLGSLLYSAHVLRMLPLLDVLHNFIFWATATEDTENGLLYGVLSMVFSDQVLQAAVGSSTISKETYMKNVLTRSINLCATDLEGTPLLKPVGEFDTDNCGTTCCQAQLLHGFAGGKAGDEVEVAVGVLQEPGEPSFLQLASDEYRFRLPAQLLVGTRIDQLTNPEGFEALMNKHRQQ